MLHFNIVYFLFFVDIEVVYLNFIYDFFIRFNLILNNAILSIMINLVTIIAHKFLKYDILFKSN